MVRKSGKRPSFFKIMIGDFTNTIRIPSAFTKRYKRFQPTPPPKYILKVTGNSCSSPVEVNMRREDGDGFLFDHGWPRFVENNFIEFGDLLLFTYVATSKFNVKIFDKTGCEKNISAKKRSLEQNIEYQEKQRSRKRSKSVSLDSEEDNRQPIRVNGKKGSAPPVASNNGLGAAAADSSLEKGHGSLSSIKRRKGCTARKEHPILISTKRKKDGRDVPIRKKSSGMPIVRRNSQLAASPTRRPLLTPQSREQGAIEVSNEFKFATPFYRVVLRATYVNINKPFMHIPFSFLTYVRKISGVGTDVPRSEWNVRLRQVSDGRKWSVRLTYSKAKAYFCGGWNAFVADNKLGEGDICVFECRSMKGGVVHVDVKICS